jgi:CRISPR-associated endonuclease Cas2
MTDIPQLKKIQYKKWQLRKEVLEIIILSLLSGGGSPMRPTLPLLVKGIVNYFNESKKLNIEENKVKRILKNLQKNNILLLDEKGEEVIVTKVNNENSTVIKYSIKAIIEYKKKKKKWNNKWFMVFFDVPEIQKSKREYLRKFLKQLGFYQYQKSVYIFPYECEKEVVLIKKIVEGAKYMKYIIAEKIEDEGKIKTFFKL